MFTWSSEDVDSFPMRLVGWFVLEDYVYIKSLATPRSGYTMGMIYAILRPGVGPRILLEVDIDEEFVGPNANMLRPFLSS